jgi:hypothetical protein
LSDIQQKFGSVLNKYTLRLKTYNSKQEMITGLTTVIADSRHVVARLKAVGVPDIRSGRALAAEMIQTFEQIGNSDAVWRSELRRGVWVWPDPSASRVKRERIRVSVGALVLTGREFERLAKTRGAHEVMARNPICQKIFGVVPVSG